MKISNFFSPIGRAPKNQIQHEKMRLYFVYFCAYYLFSTYLIPSSGVVERYSLIYFLLVIPGWVYVGINWKLLFIRVNLFVCLWWVFITSAIFVSIVQNDFSLAYNSLYMGLLAIVIINSGGFLRTKEINILFLITILGSILVYTLGITDYGFFPYLSDIDTCHKSLSYRVSLFRVLSESAAFSFFVLLWNVYDPNKKNGWIRYICIFLSLYFILFSGIRSAILTLFIVSPLLIFHLLRLKNIALRFNIYLISSIFLAGFIFTQSSLFSMNGVRNFVSNHILRTNSCSAIAEFQRTMPTTLEQRSNSIGEKFISEFVGIQIFSSSWLEQTINRHCSARYQLEIFLDNPFFGNSVVRPSSLEQEARVGCSHEALQRFCDACVLATYWLSRGGMAGVIFIAIYFVTFALALWRKSMLGITTLLSFGLILQAWGVMFVPYNFTFFMLMSLISIICFTDEKIKKAG